MIALVVDAPLWIRFAGGGGHKRHVRSESGS